VGDKSALASRFILASYLFGKTHARETNLSELEFAMPVHKEIQAFILNATQVGTVRFSDLYEYFGEEYADEISRLAGMEAEENKSFDQGAYFFDCVRTLKKDALTKKIESLSAMCVVETDTAKRRELTAEISKLLLEKRKLN
jgi:hypothetical protein